MRLEIAERLRCPHPHAPTPLIVVADRVIERDLIQGRAGCPVCRSEARVEEGDVWFDAPVAATGAASVPSTPADHVALERLVALLGLAEPEGTVLLTGAYARFALLVATSAEVGVVTLADHGSPASAGYRRGLAVSAVHGVASRLPFADATFRAAAVDTTLASSLVTDVVRAVRVGGRVVAAAALDRPAGVRELARDATEWVGERESAAPLVPLGRGGGD